MNTREQGRLYEEQAAQYLVSKGYVILERNYHTHFGEIDIIAMEGGYLVFIEVKYRKNAAVQHPAAAVGAVKQSRICKCALTYIKKQNIDDSFPVRFDVLSILGETISLYKNAFDFVI